MAKKIAPTVDSTVESLIDDAYSAMEELRDELQDWYDNLPENFQSGDKGSQLQEAIDAMQRADSAPSMPALPDAYASKTVTWTPSTKKKMSRSDRCSEALGMLNLAVTTISAMMEQSLAEDAKKEEEDKTEEEPGVIEFPYSDLESLRDELEEAISEFESVEFPGMFG